MAWAAKRDLVECGLDHAVHPRSLSLGAVGYVSTNPPTWSVLARRVVLVAIRFSVMTFSLGERSLMTSREEMMHGKSMQTKVVDQILDLFPRLARTKGHDHRGSLHAAAC